MIPNTSQLIREVEDDIRYFNSHSVMTNRVISYDDCLRSIDIVLNLVQYLIADRLGLRVVYHNISDRGVFIEFGDESVAESDIVPLGAELMEVIDG